MASVVELLIEAIVFLGSKNIPQPQCDGEWLLAHILKCSRLELYLRHEIIVCLELENCFRKLLNRRAMREPLQYILGEVDFCDVKLNVDQRVLIPRSETELLVEWLVHHIKKYHKNTIFHLNDRIATKQNSKLNILDLGTGSGAIAIALAKYFPESLIIAADRSSVALDVAKKNMMKNNIQNIQFLKSNWYQVFQKDGMMKSFDIIISNPPYLTQREFDGSQDEIRKYEPIDALVAGNDGLADIEIILQGAKKFLKKDGIIAIETGILHPKVLQERYKRYFQKIEILQDLNQFDRFFIAHVGH